MTGAQAGSGIAMEVFVKQHQVTPMRVGLELFEISENCWELDLEIRPKIVMEFLQRLDQQVVYREPNGAAPVGIAAKHSGRGFARLVTHSVFHSVYAERVRMVAMEL